MPNESTGGEFVGETETPTTEQRVNNLSEELDALTENNYNVQISLAETLEAIGEADEELEAIKAAHLGFVLTDRFEINQKLKYTNDDQRKIAVLEATNADGNFISMQAARKTLISTQSTQKAEIERGRNLHKSKLLVLQFYSNQP